MRIKSLECYLIGKALSALLLILAAGASAADAPHRKLSADSIAATSKPTMQVIVQWKIAAGADTQAKIANLDGRVVREFKFIKGGTYLIPGGALSQLEADPDVAYVSIDRQIKNKLDYTAAAVNARAALGAGWTGTGIGIAVIDSGMNSDPNLSKPVYSGDFTGATGKNLGQDQYGHGQHVAGIIASTSASTIKGNTTRNFVGLAPGASLINLRVLDASGEGSDSNVIAAIETAIELKGAYNIRVINLSLGRPVSESYKLDPLCQAAEAAWKAGIVVVVAAGNDGRDNSFGNVGYGTITAPGNDPYVITVGAMKTEATYDRSDDLIATYSSKGPTQVDHIVKPDLVAPGNRVVSLLAVGSTLVSQNPANSIPLNYYQNTSKAPGDTTSKNFFLLSGTSMAAPVVSGAAADLLQLNSALTPDQVKTLLMQTAYKTFPVSSTVIDPTTAQTFVSYYDVFTVGAGYLDLGAAVAAVKQVPTSGTSLSPVARYDSTTGNVTVAYDPSSVFANRAVWGSQAIWGARAVWGASTLDTADRAVWGSQAIWGNTTDAAQRAVWGARSIWGATDSAGSESSPLSLSGEN